MVAVFRPLLLALALLLSTAALAQPPAPSAGLKAAQEQAAALAKEGRYRDAIPLAETALRLGEAEFDRLDIRLANLATALGRLHELQGRYGDAERRYRQALRISNKILGWKHIAVANSLSNLANVLRLLGRYETAEGYYERALAVGTRALGPMHPNLGTYMNNLALLYRAQGRLSETERLYSRAMALIVQARGPDHPDVAIGLNNVASLYFDRGRYNQAERFLRRALDRLERIYGPDHPEFANGLNNLASVYVARGNIEAAEQMLRRVLQIRTASLGDDHPSIASTLTGLATLAYQQEIYVVAQQLLESALAIREASMGAQSIEAAQTRNDLGVIHFRQGQSRQAVQYLNQALEVNAARLGDDHIEVSANLSNLGELSRLAGDFAAARRLHRRALDIRTRAFGETHPDVAYSAFKLSQVNSDAKQYRDALSNARRATNIYRKISAVLSRQKSQNALTEQARRRPAFVHHVDVIGNRITEAPDETEQLTAEAFEVAQLAQSTGTAQTIQRMSARFAAGKGALAEVVRTRQDALERWRQIDAQLTEALSRAGQQRSLPAERKLHQEMAKLTARMAALDKLLAEQYPEYAELVNTAPVSISEVRALLRPDEAMLVYLIADSAAYVFVLRHDREALIRLELDGVDITDMVFLLRASLNPTAVIEIADLEPFEIEEAHALYQGIFAPAEAMLDGVDHVMIVADGPLQSLPFGALVTDATDIDGADFAAYGAVPWLIKRYALTILPSVSAHRALRGIARATAATEPLIGFGDPLLRGEPGDTSGIDSRGLFSAGGLVRLPAVNRLPRLPDTADELRALARSLQVGDEALYLQGAASEAAVYRVSRSGALRKYRVVAFATHGLMAGEFDQTNEPALVMTPPEFSSKGIDGLLTASEIAGLDMDAEWVILSACNTAASDGTPGAEGLSGLAKAFFYAGSRALLVSHWAVFSVAARRLVTGVFEAARADPSIIRAEALRRSMLAFMADRDKPQYAHPIFWAPFIVVGEGGGKVL